MTAARIAFTCLLALSPIGSAMAQNPFVTGNESSGVQNRSGDTSPTPGFSAGQTNSRIDDYYNQDEQINVDPDTGVLRVLRVNQKNLLNDFVTAVLPLRNVSPREVREVMRTVTGLEGGRAEVILDRQLNENFLQVICPKFMLPYIADAIAALDVPWLMQDRDGSATLHYSPLHRHISNLDPLASLYSGGEEGASQLDNLYNTVARRDEPIRIDRYLEAARLFDRPAPHSLLKFRVYEVDSNNDLSLGVDWISWKNGPGRGLFEAIFGGQESHHQFDNATGHFDPNLGALTILSNGSGQVHREATQFLVSANYVLTSAYLDFLRVKGKARVLAEPEIYVLTSRVASWSSVDQTLGFAVDPANPGANGIIPQRLDNVNIIANGPGVAVDQISSDFSAHNRFLNHTIRAELGIALNVFSVVGLETSEVEIEFVSTDLAGVTPQGTPMISSRRLVTKVNLRNGEPFVLGSLSRNERVNSANKAPWLGDIPVLGYLFGQENNVARQKEIVVTVVPEFFQGTPKELLDVAHRDTIAMASGQQDCEATPNAFCFDKWLSDTVEFPRD